MAAVARERIAAEGWPNITIVQSPAEDIRALIEVAGSGPASWRARSYSVAEPRLVPP